MRRFILRDAPRMHPSLLARRGLASTSTFVDTLIIGTGVAGSSAALTLAKSGRASTMLSAAPHALECNSAWAQGGIIYKGLQDSPSLLAQDVHYAGAGLCNDSSVMHLATQGPGCVEELLLSAPVNVPFDRDAQTGGLSLCLEASHNTARIIHWRDQTGLAITQSMQEAVARDPNIQVLTSRTAVDLLTNASGACIGARVVNTATQQEEIFLANHTLLAAGGVGEVFQHTSNHESARGDGLAMAHRAGAELSALEYVQFHPTTFFLPGERSFLLTEALRGEGARLLNKHGRAFAKDYHELGELAPRDVVSRMIVSEMERTGSDHVWLDISHRDSAWLQGRFPAIYAHTKAKGFDMTRGPLPVVPAAHYFCGGVSVDLEGVTSVPGLYAAGEVSCTGLHGGNRLASTSLLEGLVWGRAVANHMLRSPSSSPSPSHPLSPHLPKESQAASQFESESIAPTRAVSVLPHNVSVRVAELWGELQSVMWADVGIKRSPTGLARAQGTLARVQAEVDRLEREYFHPVLRGLKNGVQTGALIAHAAASNPESRGAHYISSSEDPEDAPEPQARFPAPRTWDPEHPGTGREKRFFFPPSSFAYLISGEEGKGDMALPSISEVPFTPEMLAIPDDRHTLNGTDSQLNITVAMTAAAPAKTEVVV